MLKQRFAGSIQSLQTQRTFRKFLGAAPAFMQANMARAACAAEKGVKDPDEASSSSSSCALTAASSFSMSGNCPASTDR